MRRSVSACDARRPAHGVFAHIAAIWPCRACHPLGGRQQESLERRSASIDTKAGLVLAAAGILVSLSATDPDLLDIAVQLAAATAGALAAWSFLPRVAGNLSPLRLRDRYINRPADVTALVVLDTLLTIHADDEKELLTKVARLRRAFVALALAVLLTLVGSILQVTREAITSDDPPATTETTRPGTGPVGLLDEPGAAHDAEHRWRAAVSPGPGPDHQLRGKQGRAATDPGRGPRRSAGSRPRRQVERAPTRMNNHPEQQPPSDPPPAQPAGSADLAVPAMMLDTELIVDVVKGSEAPPEHKTAVYVHEADQPDR